MALRSAELIPQCVVWEWQEGLPDQRSPHRLDNIAAVVLSAFVEHNPRPLLRAIAHGIPVIASEACGVAGLPGVTTVTAGDSAQLRAEILKMCS